MPHKDPSGVNTARGGQTLVPAGSGAQAGTCKLESEGRQAMANISRNHRAVKERIKALKRKWAKGGEPCHLCEQPIDYTLPQGHPGAVEADHYTPVAVGGHPLGPMFAAHRLCNQRRQHKSVEEFKAGKNIRIDDAGKPTELPEVREPLEW